MTTLSRREQTGTRRPAGPGRLIVALGDPERERAWLPDLIETGEFVVVERCLGADQLLAALQRERADAALVAFDLHRLTSTALAELARSRTPVVFLGPDPREGGRRDWPGTMLPLDAGADAVREALLAAVRGEPNHRKRSAATPPGREPAPAPVPEEPPADVSIVALASGHGSPGRTTIAVSLAAALGAVAPTVLVDADLSGPSVAAYLDADPTRNLYMLAHAEPITAAEWDRALAQELQPLADRCPHAAVLCGVPKPEMRTALTTRYFDRLLEELGRRYRYVIVDTGADLLGPETALHRAALARAHRVLLVASADLVGLWHARVALGLLRTHLQVEPDRVALLINRHDRRYHHSRSEIEWALGVSTAAVIPHDHRGAQRAIAAQRPLMLQGRSRAGRALLDLAERLSGGAILLPPEAAEKPPNRLRRALSRPRSWLRKPGPGKAGPAGGRHHGDGTAHLTATDRAG